MPKTGRKHKNMPFFWIKGSRRQSKGQDVDHTNELQNDKDQTQNTEGTSLLTEKFLKLLLLSNYRQNCELLLFMAHSS